MITCKSCNLPIMEPGKVYGYVGQVCMCSWNLPKFYTRNKRPRAYIYQYEVTGNEILRLPYERMTLMEGWTETPLYG